MNYEETLRFLYSQLPMFQRIGAAAYKADLDTTIELCRRLGDPQICFPSIHIAGTNGKGSVAHMIASILQTAGMKTGLYTSPHLRDFRERILINGKMIPEAEVVAFVKSKHGLFGSLEPSFFELTYGMAMDHFCRSGIDIAVVETGMGGRLDSTNTVRSILSVITNVSLDHMQFLGDTVEKIAAEKAGIIKRGVPVVIGESQERTDPVFIEKAGELEAPIVFADRHYKTEPAGQEGSQGLPLDIFKEGTCILERLKAPLAGNYQRRNIATVFQAIETFQESHSEGIGPEVIREGIEEVVRNTSITGRWQVLSEQPVIICDAAHNEAALKESLRQVMAMAKGKLHFVLGFVSDKAVESLLALFPKEAHYYFCRPDIPRGLDADALREKAAGSGLHGNSHSSVAEALDAAKRAARPEDAVYVGGSSFVVAEVV